MTDDLIEQAEELCESLKDGDDDYAEERILITDLVAEIKRLQAQVENCRAAKNLHARRAEKLQEQLAAKDDLLTQTQITIQMHHSNVLELQKELDRWQKIAIDLKAVSYFVNLHSREEVFGLQPTDIQDLYKTRAAKELGVQVTQEAGYLERLEKAFVFTYGLHYYNTAIGYRPTKSEVHAATQDALEKIRRG